MNLSLPQDKEQIKNHMVLYMIKAGSVSKTLFGIELGTVCKFPTRGRTKMVIEAYPDVFAADGDTVHLRHPPTQLQLPTQFQMQPSSDPSHHLVSQPADPFFLPPNTSTAFLSGVASPEAHFYHPSPTFHTPPPPTPSYFVTPPQQENRLYATGGMAQAELQSKVMFPQYSEGGGVSEYMETQLVAQSGELQVPAPEEQDVVAILNTNGGSMQVQVLLMQLGAKESNPFEQAQLFELLTKCSSVSVQDGVAYVCERRSQSSPQPSRMGEFTAVLQSSQTNGGSIVETTHKQIPTSDAAIRDLSDVQSVSVDSIHIQNINIEVVNLHLHIEDSNNLQMSKLVELQTFLQEAFQVYLKQKQQL